MVKDIRNKSDKPTSLDDIDLSISDLNVHMGSERLDLKLKIGNNRTKRPFDLETPFFMGSNCILTLGPEIVLGISLGISLSGFPITLRGRPSKELSELLKLNGSRSIMRFGPERTDIDLNSLKKADLIEIVPASSFENSTTDDKKLNMTIRRLPELRKPKDIASVIELLRSLTDSPLMVTIRAQTIEKDMDSILVCEPDIVNIECNNGPNCQRMGIGKDMVPSIIEARRHMEVFKARDRGIRLAISGPMKTPLEALKLFSLGADLLSLDHIITAYLSDHTYLEQNGFIHKELSNGVGSVDWAELGEDLDILLKAFREDFYSLLTDSNIYKRENLNMDLLVARTYEMASITGLPLCGLGRILPIWKH